MIGGMTTITIPLAENQLAQLHRLARQAQVTAEELARTGLEDWLRRRPDDDEKLLARSVRAARRKAVTIPKAEAAIKERRRRSK
jgi:hypothetical protein